MSAGGGGQSSGISHRKGGKYTTGARSRNRFSQGLMLVSMMDILTLVMFFLLKNFSNSQSMSMASDITLPNSASQIPPMSALQLVVTQKGIILDNEQILTFENGDIDKSELNGSVLITKLALKLKEKKDRHLDQGGQTDEEKKAFAGTIIMQADKNLQFNLLKKVIYTAGVTDFVMLKLAVLKNPDEA